MPANPDKMDMTLQNAVKVMKGRLNNTQNKGPAKFAKLPTSAPREP